jgi:hypothetical protein
MQSYGWKDRTYDSIPKAHRGARAYWLTMDHMERDRQLSQAQAEDFAWAQVYREDHPELELQA